MKISFVTKNPGYHSSQMIEAGKRMNIKIDVLDVMVEKDFLRLGDVVVWRSATIKRELVKDFLFKSGKVLFFFNKAIFENKKISQKYFQQKTSLEKGIPSIETFIFKDKKALAECLMQKKLKFPIICKPNLGSKGQGIFLLKQEKDIFEKEFEIRDFVFQNFIKNKGDFRVLVLGGKVLGVMKRKAKRGSFLNNFSQGGTIELVRDKKIIEQVSSLSTKIASIFNLFFCGVDIIFDIEKQQYLFLEVNTVPEWKGFQEASGIDVAEEIIKTCLDMRERKNGEFFDLIEKYYKNNFSYLRDKQFHFASRLFLWKKDQFSSSKLKELKSEYIGEKEQDYKIEIQEILSEKSDFSRVVYAEKRADSFKKYSDLLKYNKLLFKYLFCKSIYNIDLGNLIKKFINEAELMDLRKRLLNDVEAIKSLSTHAVNFIYLLDYFLEKDETAVDPEYFLEISKKGYSDNEEDVSLRMYLLTHCIIGESAFYSRKIQKNLNIYVEMLKDLNKIVEKNYQKISLDNKYEFLVCSKLCGIDFPETERRINEDAKKSISDFGNFLVDKDGGETKRNADDIVLAEHRNVLALMSQGIYEK